MIFYQSAKQYAYDEARQALEKLQQSILPLIKINFMVSSSSAASDSDSSNTTNSNTLSPNNSSSEQIRNFIRQVSTTVIKTGGNTQLIILESNMNVIYPREEQERIAITPLAEEFIKYIQDTDTLVGNDTVKFESSDGQVYLVNIYKVPTKSVQIKYLIAYCPTSEIGSWVEKASILVLSISSLFVLLIFFVLWITARSITQPLYRLCREVELIGNGNFVEIEQDFSLKELEELRLAINMMSSQLMRADEIQKNFFQNVSHELRNPLMSISGYAQGIEQRIFRSSQEAAHTILEESIRLTELVNSLLTLSHLESEQYKSVLESVKLSYSIEDCLNRLNGLAIQKGISFVLNPFDCNITAYCDEDLLIQVLDNLLTNAIRHAKTTVTVTVLPCENQIAISVSDDGDGIAEKDMAHLFERCYKGKGGNFGIGLAIARSASHKMGGNLKADNQKNSGAIFTLYLKN